MDNVVFVRFPHKITNEGGYQRLTRINRVSEIIAQAGFPYLDLERMGDEIVLDYWYDFYNPDHLNIYGQMKVTEYLTDWIMTEYGLTLRPQTDENRAQWEKSVEYMDAFYELASERIEEQKTREMYEKFDVMDKLEDKLLAWQ